MDELDCRVVQEMADTSTRLGARIEGLLRYGRLIMHEIVYDVIFRRSLKDIQVLAERLPRAGVLPRLFYSEKDAETLKQIKQKVVDAKDNFKVSTPMTSVNLPADSSVSAPGRHFHRTTY